MTDKKTIQEISVDARLLHQKLKTIEIGATVTWDDLSSVIGRDVRDSGYSALTTARRRVQIDDGMIFDAVHTIGLKRLTDIEIVSSGQSFVDRVRRIARKGAKRLLSVKDFDKLPNNVKVSHNAYASLLGAITQVSSESKVRMLEKHVQNTQQALPLAKTLEVFKT